MTRTPRDLIESASQLAPLLAHHAAEAERMRQPHDEVIRRLREAGIFEMMVPRCYGGLEFDLDTFLEVGLALAEGDASMAWVTCFYIEHNWMLCQFPESFQKSLYAHRSHWLAPASIAPGGVARPTDGGFRLSGRWKWGTGIVHAEWVLVNAIVEDPSSPDPAIRLFALPRDAVSMDDTWHVDGMVATGSHDIVIDDAVVPEDRTVDLFAMTSGTAPGARCHAGPLYRTPMIPILALTAAMPALGQARAAIRTFRERLTERVLYGTAGVKQSDKPAAQMRLARADVEVQQVELAMRAVVAQIMALRDRATLLDRARWTATLALGVDQCKRILQSISEASGASAHFLDNPLQRSLRDVSVIACHVVFDLDQRLEIYGRALLGRDPEGPV